MAKILLAVDLSYQCYRASAAHPMLTSRIEQKIVFTGGLYGFYTTLAKTIRETQATHIAFCQDIKPYRRSETYPEYKQLRKARADDDLLKMHKQSMALILESFQACGLAPWGIQGFESDDLVAHCVMKYRHRYDRIYAASNDSDLYQLLWADNFAIYRKNRADIVTAATLVRDMGVTPDQFMLMTALSGTHNDIAGIPSVGSGRALAAVKDAALLRKYRDGYGQLIERNLGLIKLPHAEFPWAASIPSQDAFRPRELYKFLGRYDIEVTGAISSALDELKR